MGNAAKKYATENFSWEDRIIYFTSILPGAYAQGIEQDPEQIFGQIFGQIY